MDYKSITRILIFIGILVILDQCWEFLEVMFDGGKSDSIADTVMGVIIATLIYCNLGDALEKERVNKPIKEENRFTYTRGGVRPPTPSQRDIEEISSIIKSSMECESERLKTFGVDSATIERYAKWHTKKGRRIERGKSGNH